METKDVLKQLRKSRGFESMKEFCNAVGISFNTYQNYETGKRVPTADMLITLADFYGVSVDYLLNREPETDPLKMFNISAQAVDSDKFIEEYEKLPELAKQIFIDTMLRLSQAAVEQSEDKMKAELHAELDRQFQTEGTAEEKSEVS